MTKVRAGVLALFILMLFSVASYWYLQQRSTPPSTDQQTDDLSTITWKEYSQNDRKLSFKYPDSWTVSVIPGNDVPPLPEGECCATTQIRATNGTTEWYFAIDEVFTGYDGFIDNPDYCYPEGKTIRNENEVLCDVVTTSDHDVMEYEVEKRTYYRIGDNKTYYVLFASPQAHGFGPNQDGVSQYTLSYRGDGIDDNMAILDEMTKSLTFSR